MSRDKQTEIANDLNMHCVSLSEQFCGEMSCNACILGCSDCPFINDSQACAASDKSALEVLNSQEQRIKELAEENERLRAEKETLEIYNKDYKYKNKELTAFNRRWAKECAELQEECEYIKADTVKKMQERLKAVAHNIYDMNGVVTGCVVFGSDIDQIAKEMLEGEK